MADAQKILKVLREDLKLQTRHCRLLEAQQRALLACDRPRFCGLQEEHGLMLALLEAQEAVRRAALQDAAGNASTLSALLENLPGREQRTLAAVRQELRQTLERVQTLSRQNQQLIQNELEYIAFTLDLFVEAGRRAESAYGGRGGLGGRLLLDRRA